MFEPTQTQQYAVQAKLNGALGRVVFDRLFLGMEIGTVNDGDVQVWVKGEHCALVIQDCYLDVLAAVTGDVLNMPIKTIRILPWTFRTISHHPGC